jgi:hypothetical protein
MEGLESRELMAVGINTSLVNGSLTLNVNTDITASVVNGNLFVNEASGQTNTSNGVRIAKLANGMIRVQGTLAANESGSGADSRINGSAFRDFSVTGSLFVNLGGGNDLVQIGFSDGSGAPNFNEVQIKVGTAPQVATFSTTSTSIVNVPDDDQVMVWTGSTGGSMLIDTGPGTDWAFLGTAEIGDFVGIDKLTINTGASYDQVTMMGTIVHGNTDIQTYSSVSEVDQDGVYFDFHLGTGRAMEVDGNTEVRMGGGDDNFYITDQVDLAFPDELVPLALQTHGSLVVDMGAGNDYAFARSANIGDQSGHGTPDANGVSDNFVLKMGAGADNVVFRNVFGAASIDIQMSTQSDLVIYNVSPLFDTDVDTVSLENVSTGLDLKIGTGGGADIIRVDDAVAFRDLTIDAGDGNDRVDLVDHVISLGFARLLGGSGVDRLNKSSNTSLQNGLLQTGWEYINGFPQLVVNPVATRR